MLHKYAVEKKKSSVVENSQELMHNFPVTMIDRESCRICYANKTVIVIYTKMSKFPFGMSCYTKSHRKV